MIIDFNDLPEQHLEAFKGGQKEYVARMFTDSRVKIMRGHLEPGASIGLHTHEGNSEIIFMLNGRGHVIYDDTTETLLPGQAHYCPMDHAHSLINNSDAPLDFFAVVPEHHQE